MKAIRKIAPAVLILAVLIGAAVIILLVTQGQKGQSTVGQTEDTSNATLSNLELVNKAVTNMRQLSSYHIEFHGPIDGPYTPIQQTRFIADVHLRGPGDWAGALEPDTEEAFPTPITVPGSTFKVSYDRNATQYNVPVPPEESVTDWSEEDLIWASDGRFYWRADKGQTWEGESTALAIWAIFPFIGCWMWPDYWGPYDQDGLPVAPASSGLTFKLSDPAQEKIDGVLTRHVVANISDRSVYGFTPDDLGRGPSEMHLWVSMGATPTVYKLVLKGTWSAQTVPNPTPGSNGITPYALTWQWSRFNEEFPEVKPPVTDSIR